MDAGPHDYLRDVALGTSIIAVSFKGGLLVGQGAASQAGVCGPPYLMHAAAWAGHPQLLVCTPVIPVPVFLKLPFSLSLAVQQAGWCWVQTHAQAAGATWRTGCKTRSHPWQVGLLRAQQQHVQLLQPAAPQGTGVQQWHTT